MNNKEYTFLWSIENYSYCWHKTGQKLTSPVFTLHELRGTAWTLSLYPKGGVEHPEWVLIQLDRSEDNGPMSLTVNYELSIVSEDGSPLISYPDSSAFSKKCSDYPFNFVEVDKIFSEKRDTYLPKDTLTVRCKLWITKGNGDAETICARTRIGIGHISFLLVVDGFTRFESNQLKTYEIYSYTQKAHIKLCVYISDWPCCEGKVMVEFMPSDSHQILAKCNIYFLKWSGQKLKCAEADSRFRSDRKVIQKFPLSLTKDAILKKRSGYLLNDELSLLCECDFSMGIEFERIEAVQNPLNSHFEKLVGSDSSVRCTNILTEKLSACPSAFDDLKGLSTDDFLTDVILKTKSNSFPAHKVVLCARSPVFKVMLSNDMKEKNSGSIEVDDLEDETVKHLLHFLYCDKLDDLQWETATKLYYVADKYEIKKLRLICSSFLVDKLTVRTAPGLLLLADLHSDNDLKKVVENFILEHDDEIFVSDEWKALIGEYPLLAATTMYLKYETRELYENRIKLLEASKLDV